MQMDCKIYYGKRIPELQQLLKIEPYVLPIIIKRTTLQFEVLN